MDDEDQSIRRCQAGDTDAFNRLVLTHEATVYNYLAHFLGDRELAADIAQETFVAAFRAIHRFQGGNFRAWLMRIATNQAIDAHRQRARRPSVSLEAWMSFGDDDVGGGDRLPQPGDGPEQVALRAELIAEMRRALLTLPVDQRATVILCDVQGLSYEEAAQAMQANIGTIRSRLSRGREKLRLQLRAHGELLPERYR